MTVKKGCDPFADLLKDIQSIPAQSRDKAKSRADEVILGAMTKIKVRKLQLENNKTRSASRSREPDSDDEESSSKIPKASPLSPPNMGPGSECWPALPTPGAKVCLQEPIQALGGQVEATPRKEPPGTSSPRKVLPPTKVLVTPPQQSPTGATSPHKDPMAPKGPEAQPQPNSSQVALKSDGPASGLKDPLVPVRTPKHTEEESASKGVPQKGTKEGPLEAGHPGVSNKWTKEVLKSQGSNLKTPQPRPQGSTGKGDSKVTLKARQ